jgi:hypothetical protein
MRSGCETAPSTRSINPGDEIAWVVRAAAPFLRTKRASKRRLYPA